MTVQPEEAPVDEHDRRRREFLLAGAAAGVVTACAVPSIRERSPQWQARQFHNQPAQSHQQQFLVDLWEQVKKETAAVSPSRSTRRTTTLRGPIPARSTCCNRASSNSSP